MTIKIVSQRRNEPLRRDEILFILDHKDGGTPTRIEVRKRLADMLKADIERVYIRKIETKTGSTVASGEASIYDLVENARDVESEHIILRNSPKVESEKKSDENVQQGES